MQSDINSHDFMQYVFEKIHSKQFSIVWSFFNEKTLTYIYVEQMNTGDCWKRPK